MKFLKTTTNAFHHFNMAGAALLCASVISVLLFAGCQQNRYQPADWEAYSPPTTLPRDGAGRSAERFGTLAGGTLPGRFGTLPGRFGTLPGRFGTLPGRFGTLPGRFGTLPGRQLNNGTLPTRDRPGQNRRVSPGRFGTLPTD